MKWRQTLVQGGVPRTRRVRLYNIISKGLPLGHGDGTL